MKQQETIWLAYLRDKLPAEERAVVQQNIIETEGYAEALADFEYAWIDEQARRRSSWRGEIVAIAAMVLLAVIWVLRPADPTVIPAVFIAAGNLREAAATQTIKLPPGARITFELELPTPAPGGVCSALGQTGTCSGPVFRLTLPRPAAGPQEIELRHDNQLHSVYVFTIE